MSGGPWIDAELQAGIELYDKMHQCVMAGKDYNKAQMIRDARCFDGCHQPLIGRSKGSIEMKLMNITAAVESFKRHDLSMAEFGYRPMKNMQKALKDAVEMWIAFEPVRLPSVAKHMGYGN